MHAFGLLFLVSLVILLIYHSILILLLGVPSFMVMKIARLDLPLVLLCLVDECYIPIPFTIGGDKRASIRVKLHKLL